MTVKQSELPLFFWRLFPLFFFPSISDHLFSLFSCNPMCAFLCTSFLHSPAVLFLIFHTHSPMFLMFLCILGKTSQMYVLWSGKNLGFSSFLNEKIERRDKPAWEQLVALRREMEMSACISGYDWNKSPDVDFQQHWSPLTSAFCFHPCKFFMCKVWVSEIEGEQDQNGWLWGKSFRGWKIKCFIPGSNLQSPILQVIRNAGNHKEMHSTFY